MRNTLDRRDSNRLGVIDLDDQMQNLRCSWQRVFYRPAKGQQAKRLEQQVASLGCFLGPCISILPNHKEGGH